MTVLNHKFSRDRMLSGHVRFREPMVLHTDIANDNYRYAPDSLVRLRRLLQPRDPQRHITLADIRPVVVPTVTTLLLIATIGLLGIFGDTPARKLSRILPVSDAIARQVNALPLDRAQTLVALVKSPDATLRAIPQQDFLALMGLPDLVRREGAVQVLQYRDKACLFDLFYHADNPLPVYIDWHATPASDIATQRTCLMDLALR